MEHSWNMHRWGLLQNPTNTPLCPAWRHRGKTVPERMGAPGPSQSLEEWGAPSLSEGWAVSDKGGHDTGILLLQFCGSQGLS